MTAEEAARECINALAQLSFDSEKLRSLGYVIVPIHPSEALIERIAREIQTTAESQIFHPIDWRCQTRRANAAYAAITEERS